MMNIKYILPLAALFTIIIQVYGDGVIMCYYGSWSNERSGKGRFGVSDIPTDLCTHIIYSFITPTSAGDIVVPTQQTIDNKSNTLEDFAALKQCNSALKLMVAIGGYSEGSANFSTIVNNDTLRSTFVTKLVSFIDEYGLDGLDVDWEYPSQRDGSADTDKENFVLLLKELRAEFDTKGYLLTAAVAVTQSNIDLSYNVTGITENVDYLNLMLYDFHGTWDTVTGVNAPLTPQLTDDSSLNLNVNYSVHTWLNNSAPASQLVLGCGLYGKSFTLSSLNDTDTGAAFSAAGAAGPYLAEAGSYSYLEICENQLNYTDSWSITVEDSSSYVYGNNGTFWVGYDNVDTITAKVQYAKQMGLAGIMVWAVDLDDFPGICGTKFPLLSAAASTWNSC